MSQGTATKKRHAWASLAQGADHLGVSEKTLRRMIAAGHITGYRMGPRLLRVDLNELDDAMRPIPVGGGRIA